MPLVSMSGKPDSCLTWRTWGLGRGVPGPCGTPQLTGPQGAADLPERDPAVAPALRAGGRGASGRRRPSSTRTRAALPCGHAQNHPTAAGTSQRGEHLWPRSRGGARGELLLKSAE